MCITAELLLFFAISPAVAAAPAGVTPPSPRAAALAAERANPPLPTTRSLEQDDWLLVPRTYSLGRDPGFTPWSSFFVLGDDRIARWTTEGTSLGGGLGCDASRQPWCAPLAQALLALVWTPHDSPIGLFSGLSVTSLADKTGMRTTPGFVAGLSFHPGSLVSVVRRLRAGHN
jgi:hypothetical protein